MIIFNWCLLIVSLILCLIGSILTYRLKFLGVILVVCGNILLLLRSFLFTDIVTIVQNTFFLGVSIYGLTHWFSKKPIFVYDEDSEIDLSRFNPTKRKSI